MAFRKLFRLRALRPDDAGDVRTSHETPARVAPALRVALTKLFSYLQLSGADLLEASPMCGGGAADDKRTRLTDHSITPCRVLKKAGMTAGETHGCVRHDPARSLPAVTNLVRATTARIATRGVATA